MAEITKTASNSVPNYVWIGLATLAIATYFVGLTMPLIGPDEPRYAQVAREMYERGDWITPTLGGFPWFEKPPLLYWLEIASYNFFGVSEFAARLGPALCGLGTIACLWVLGNSIATDNEQRTKSGLASCLALIAASTLSLIIFAHGASLDIVVTFTMTAALVSFFVFDSSDARARALALGLFYLFVGLSILAKGLIGIVFPYAIVALYFVLSRRMPSGRFVLSLFWGTFLACAIASIWFVPMYFRHGWTFVDEFIVQHHFARYTSNKYQHPQPFYFFLWVLPLMLLPWTPFFFAAIWTSVKGLLNRRGAETQSENTSRPFSVSSLLLFSCAWLLVPLVFFSLSGSKLPGYILPAVPAAVVLISLYLFERVESSVRWGIAVRAGAAIVFVGIMIVSFTVVSRVSDTETTQGLFRTAAERGYRSERVYGLHMISHSAEFYAAGRLLREPGGAQKRLYSLAEVAAEMQRAGIRRALVLVPLEYTSQVQAATMFDVEFIGDNGEIAIYAVSLP